MMFDLSVGNLVEPLSGRRWSREAVRDEVAARAGRLEARGLAAGDRVLLTFGNSLEFFAELLAIWRLGGCAIPVDARLTAFETGNIARAAAAKICDQRRGHGVGRFSRRSSRPAARWFRRAMKRGRRAMPGGPASTTTR